MGEARQRRLARAAGRPWPEDAPPPPPELPWYMDPYCPELPPRRDFNEPSVVVCSDDRQQLEVLRAAVGRRDDVRLVTIVEGDQLPQRSRLPLAAPPVSRPERRRSPMEMALLLAALSLGDPLATADPKNRR